MRHRCCDGCLRKTACFKRGSRWLCDTCTGEAMRSPPPLPCKGCGNSRQLDEFGDCAACAKTWQQPAEAKP